MQAREPVFTIGVGQGRQRRTGAFISGITTNVALVIVLVLVRFDAARPLLPHNLVIVLFRPAAAPREPVDRPPPPAVPKRIQLQQQTARLIPATVVPVPLLRIASDPVVSRTPAPVIMAPHITPPPPARTAPVIGSFDAPSVAAPTNTAAARVSVGAFGASPSPQDPPRLAYGAPQVDTFGAPQSSATRRVAAEVQIQTGSFGATSSAPVARAGAPGHVSDSGFTAPSGTSRVRPAANPDRAAAGFDTVQEAPHVAKRAAVTTEPVFSSVEILTKPKPEYTDEARKLKIEGEVWLEILFSADSTVQVRRIIRSLGHGLDENAIRAAAHIRFRPANDGNHAVDQVATVRVQFQLAN